MAVFGENGGRSLGFWFRDPQKALPFDVFCVKIDARVLAVAFLKNPKNSRVTLCRGARNHVCTEPKLLNRSHARTVVRECCKGDDESQWEKGKFDPPPPKNPLTDGHQNLCR